MLSRRSLLLGSAALAAGCGTSLSPPSVPQEVELKVAASTRMRASFGYPPSGWPEGKYIRAVAALEADRENQFGPTLGGYSLALRFFDELRPLPLEPPKTAKQAEKAEEDALKAAAGLLEDLKADLVTVSPEEANWLGREGYLLPLDSFSGLEEAAVNQEFYPSVLSAFRRGGALYALPIAARPLMLHYDEHFFAAQNVPPVDASWDWNDLVEYAGRLTTFKEDGTVARWGLIAHLEGAWWVLWQNEAAVLDPDSLQCRLLEPAATEALQFVHDLMHKRRVSPPVYGIDLWRMLTSWQSLPAMLYDYSPSHFDRGTYRMGPLPQGKAHVVPMRADLGLAIPARTRHTEAAYTALMGFTLAMHKEVVIPAGRAAAARLANLRSDLREDEVAAIQHSLKYGRAEPEPSLEYPVMYEVTKRLAGGEDVATAVNAACDIVDEFKDLRWHS